MSDLPRDTRQPMDLDHSLDDFDAAKRETLRKLVIGAAFAIPVVTSFSVDGMLVSMARAQTSNQNIQLS